jgi:hypothetical protein
MPGEKIDLDQVRNAALRRMERSEKNFIRAILAAAGVESAFLLTFLFKMDTHNQLHLLLLLATMASYSIVGLGIIALGFFFNRGNLRVLKAIELLKDEIAELKTAQ